MNWTMHSDSKTFRNTVWCKSDDLQAGADGSYTFQSGKTPPIGDGSKIVVMDKAGAVLYWSAADEKAYLWSGEID